MRYLLFLLLMVACGGNTDLSGEWRTGFGTLNLTQKGDSLFGEFEGGGKFEGFIRKDTVYFRISEASFTSYTLTGFGLIKDNNNIKGKVGEEGSKTFDGTFYMMKLR